MASQVEIMNLALLQLGDEIIMSATEDTKAARVMTALWDNSLREVLEDHTWGFAKARATLALLTATPTYEFDYAYQLPSDFLRMICMGEPIDEYDWRIEGDTLVTNETEVDILYIKYEPDPARFSAKFVSALACLLAAKAANSIGGLDTVKKKEAMDAYRVVLTDAATVDSQNAPSPAQYATRWVNARY